MIPATTLLAYRYEQEKGNKHARLVLIGHPIFAEQETFTGIFFDRITRSNGVAESGRALV